MSAFVELLLQAIGFIALCAASAYGLVFAWTLWSAAVERRHEETKRLFELLERIESNTRRDP